MANWTAYQVSDFAKSIRGDFSNIPRFGHSRHIELLVSPQKSDQRDYIIGVISFVILIIFLLFLWSLLLVYFRCRGTTRWGCAAGQFTYKDEPSASRGFLRRALVWLLFLVCSVILFVTPFFLIRSAFPKIHTAAVNTRRLNQSIKSLLSDGYAATNSTLALEDTLNSTNWTQIDLRSYCGSTLNESAFLSSLNYGDATNVSFVTDERILSDSSIVDDVTQQITAVQMYLNQSKTNQVRSLLKTGLNASDTLDHVLHEFLDHDYIMKMFALFLIAILIVIFVLGLLNKCRKSPRSLRVVLFWFILPLFVLFIYFSWAIAMLITVAAVMNSDICFGGQSKSAVGTALAALKLRGDDGGILYNTILYYDSSCTTTSPWEYLNNFTKPMDAGVNASTILLLSDTSDMSDACGRDITPYISNLDAITPFISRLQDRLQFSIELSSCSRVYPLFNETFNGSICQENMDGLDLSSVLIFCIAVFGMMVITLRSALYDKKILSKESEPTHIPAVVDTPEEIKEEKRTKQSKKSLSASFPWKKRRESAVAVESPGKREKEPSDNYVSYLYTDPSKNVENEDFEVVIDTGIGSRSDEYSELSDPSKIGIVRPDGGAVNETAKQEKKSSGFFKKR